MPRAQKKPLEVITDAHIEKVPEKAFDKAVAQEAFMNEIVLVRLHETTNENDPAHTILSVNGINQPVFRGAVTPMRRMHLEVLARSWETRFTQPARDNSNPEPGNQLMGRSAHSYPFEIIEDKNPLGRAWLEKILHERS